MIAAVWAVTTRFGMIGGQAAESGTARSTPTKPHNGRASSHRIAGPMIATPAATCAKSHVRRDAPCHSSAAK